MHLIIEKQGRGGGRRVYGPSFLSVFIAWVFLQYSVTAVKAEPVWLWSRNCQNGAENVWYFHFSRSTTSKVCDDQNFFKLILERRSFQFYIFVVAKKLHPVSSPSSPPRSVPQPELAFITNLETYSTGCRVSRRRSIDGELLPVRNSHTTPSDPRIIP